MKPVPVRAIDAAFGCTLAAATIAAWFVGVAPAMEAARERNELQASLASARSEAEKIGTLRDSRAAALNALGDEAKVAPKLQEAHAINQTSGRLTMAAQSAGLTIERTSVGELAPAGRFATIPISLTLRGPSGAFALFLHRIARSFDDIAVRSFVITSGVSSSQSSPSMQVELVWHVMPPHQGR